MTCAIVAVCLAPVVDISGAGHPKGSPVGNLSPIALVDSCYLTLMECMCCRRNPCWVTWGKAPLSLPDPSTGTEAMVRNLYGSVVFSFAIIAFAQGTTGAYTHGRPLLWPARIMGYGWSDGYHAQPCAQPAAHRRGWWSGTGGSLPEQRYENPWQWNSPVGYAPTMNGRPGTSTPGISTESLPTPALENRTASPPVGPSAWQRTVTRR